MFWWDSPIFRKHKGTSAARKALDFRSLPLTPQPS